MINTLVTSGLLLAVAGAAGVAEAQQVGVLRGIVHDPAGSPVEGAVIALEGTMHSTRSAQDGRFVLEGVRVGHHILSALREGYRGVRAEVEIIADSVVDVAVALEPDAQALPGVQVDAGIVNTLFGTVLDPSDKPLAGVVVEIVGLNRKVETDEDGRFTFLDVAEGQWLVQIRKEGYRVQQRGVWMLPRIERDLTTKMRRGENSRFRTSRAEEVAKEATSRQGMRGSRSALVGREELERWGREALGAALMGSSGGLAMREAEGACVLVDGFEVLKPAVEQVRAPRAAGGITTVAPTVARNPAPQPTSGSVNAGNWLTYFKANEVELVEIFPPGTDNSRTLCGRFTSSSGCSCPPDPAGIVVWLKK